MTPPRQFPGDFDGDDVWEQLTTRWGRWQRQTPSSYHRCRGCDRGDSGVVARHWFVYR